MIVAGRPFRGALATSARPAISVMLAGVSRSGRVEPLTRSAASKNGTAKQFADAGIDDELVKEYEIVPPGPPSGRCAGIVFHPTSLPGPYGSGELGAEALRFVDWLESAGMTRWQVLPLVPPDEDYFSPYSGIDALCGNPLLISLDELVKAGLLDKGALPQPIPVADANFPEIRKMKAPLLQAAAERLLSGESFASMRAGMAEFRAANVWVEEAALFDVIRRQDGLNVAWWQWPAELRDRDASTLAALRTKHAKEIDTFIAVQYLFNVQWEAVKGYANSKGIKIVGDMPIYVGGQSADVWANPTLFALSPDRHPQMVSGVPPDAFSETGQLWGSPLYDWKAHDAEGYSWWAQRLGRAAQVYDITRIDHFRALAGYWAIEADAETAMGGVWKKGPGKKLFDAVAAKLGAAAPVIMAEDLGVITPDVVELRKAIDAPGMVVLQFAWGGGTDNVHLPHKHYPNSFVYPGTHDNETTVGWWQKSLQDSEREYLKAYIGTTGDDIAWVFIKECMKSVSDTCMIMMQDVMRLDNTHRMNSPGKAAGNWAWRVGEADVWNSLAAEASELRKLAVMYNRFKEPKVEKAAEPTLEKAAEASPQDKQPENPIVAAFGSLGKMFQGQRA